MYHDGKSGYGTLEEDASSLAPDASWAAATVGGREPTKPVGLSYLKELAWI